jgi:hypothetical protein
MVLPPTVAFSSQKSHWGNRLSINLMVLAGSGLACCSYISRIEDISATSGGDIPFHSICDIQGISAMSIYDDFLQ